MDIPARDVLGGKKYRLRLCLAALLGVLMMPTTASAEDGCYDPPGDVSGDATTNVLDVQCSIIGVLNSLLAEAPPSCNGQGPLSADLNCDDVLSVADVQLTISLALEVPLSPILDADGDQCVDACGSEDSDGDGIPDQDDAFPFDSSESVDTDGDGTGDNGDAFPDDPDEDTDTDGMEPGTTEMLFRRPR